MLIPDKEREILRREKYVRVVGIDEVGRGCLAGPVAVGHSVFTKDTPTYDGVHDSKILSGNKREKMHRLLSRHDYGVHYASPEEIDHFGINGAIEGLILKIIGIFPQDETLFLIDGRFQRHFGTNVRVVIKGDANYYIIAAAAILAKVERDRLMTELDKVHPQYGFAAHKGYGTKQHRKALRELGYIKGIHRTSFSPIRQMV